MIEFDNVTIRRDGKTILEAVSFTLARGEKAALIGKSGSGKSSVLLALVGGLSLETGEIRYSGHPVSAETVHAVRTELAFIGQEPALGAATVREALLLPFTFRAHRDKTPTEGKLVDMLERLRLDRDLLDRKTSVVSGGEKQRIAVGRALLLGKTVFLADEVTSALDPDSRDVIIGVFARPEFTLLSVSHDENWLRQCHRQFTVKNGRVTEAASST